MRLTRAEFDRIRPELRWTVCEVAGHVFNTLQTQNDTKLFWLDFIREVLAPKFASQWGVAQINNFDATQKVLLTNDLELVVPNDVETAAYFADNKDAAPLPYFHRFPQLSVLAVAFLLLLAFACATILVPPNSAAGRVLFARLV